MPLPLIPLITAGAGLAQSIIGAANAKKYTKQLENLQSPKYQQNRGILDLYNTALARYGVSPTDSAMYKRQQRDIGRNVASSLYGLQQTGNAVGGASSLLRAANDASLNANVAAENEQSRRFGELGGATQMKAGEDRTAFEVNEMQPFERKYNLLAMKAGGANQTANAGLSNIFGGLQNLTQMDMLKKMYGGGDGFDYATGKTKTGVTRNSSGRRTITGIVR